MTWYVYIIQSKPKGTLYTGIAIDPDRRLRRHNGAVKGGAKSTRGGRPWEIVYLSHCPNKNTALRREAEIKKLSRKAKLAIVERHRQLEGLSLRPPDVE